MYLNSSLNRERVRMVCPNIAEYALELWLSSDCLAVSQHSDTDENVLKILGR